MSTEPQEAKGVSHSASSDSPVEGLGAIVRGHTRRRPAEVINARRAR